MKFMFSVLENYFSPLFLLVGENWLISNELMNCQLRLHLNNYARASLPFDSIKCLVQFN